jgi:hypothetical protein
MTKCCKNDNTPLFDAAVEILKAQGKTKGFVTNMKTGFKVSYKTKNTRKSGDANTSSGNTLVNIMSTYDAYV